MKENRHGEEHSFRMVGEKWTLWQKSGLIGKLPLRQFFKFDTDFRATEFNLLFEVSDEVHQEPPVRAGARGVVIAEWS